MFIQFCLIFLTINFRYDLNDTTTVKLLDLTFLGAMGPPGGARNPVTMRYLRHFNIMATLDFSEDTMSKIFTTLMKLSLSYKQFASDIMSLIPQVVQSTLYVSYIQYIYFANICGWSLDKFTKRIIPGVQRSDDKFAADSVQVSLHIQLERFFQSHSRHPGHQQAES